MSAKLIERVIQVAWHRNGVGGAGFHAVLFESPYETCPTCGEPWGWTDGYGVTSCENKHPGPPKHEVRKMLASVFDDPGHVAVYDVAKLSDPEIGVAFGPNSWRGDRYEPELREAIRNYDSDGSVRIGPFGMPTARKARR